MKLRLKLRYQRVYVVTVETEEEAQEWSRWSSTPVTVGQEIELTVTDR